MRQSWTTSEPEAHGQASHAVEDTLLKMYCKYIARFVVELVTVVVVKINKAVVGSGPGDAPKYVGKGVALCGTSGTLGVPLLWYSCLSMAILGNFGWACFRCGLYRFQSYSW